MKRSNSAPLPEAQAPLEPNIRSQSYFLALSQQRCWKCHATTRVSGLAVPGGHERRDLDRPGANWQRCNHPSWLAGVVSLNDPVLLRMCAGNHWYRFVRSASLGLNYWMQSCERCGAKQGDLKMHSVKGNAFNPISAELASNVTLVSIPEPLIAHSRSIIDGIKHFEDMRVFKP